MEIPTEIWSFEPRISRIITDKKGLDRRSLSDLHDGVSKNGEIQPNKRSSSVIIREIRGQKSLLLPQGSLTGEMGGIVGGSRFFAGKGAWIRRVEGGDVRISTTDFTDYHG